MKVFITGAAGFIGFHQSRRLLEDGHEVFGYDSVSPYYNPSLKADRLGILASYSGFLFEKAELEDKETLDRAIDDFEPDIVLHFAAQAGVRYSIENPDAYISANIVGTYNLVNAVKRVRPKHFLLASTSSIYGANPQVPFRELDRADQPVSLYAATKKATESIAHSYSALYGVPTTALRFFTVYGPWGRPDMALFKFVESIRSGTAIDVYGYGKQSRDFTYVDDLVEAISRLIGVPPIRGESLSSEDTVSPAAPFRVVNVGGANPRSLMEFIETIEACVGETAKKNYLPMQAGDVKDTFASSSLLMDLIGDVPATDLAAGVARFVEWYDSYQSETGYPQGIST